MKLKEKKGIFLTILFQQLWTPKWSGYICEKHKLSKLTQGKKNGDVYEIKNLNY